MNKFISRIRKLLTNVDRRKTRIRPFKPKDDTDVNTTRLHVCKYTIYITPHYRVTLMYNYNTHYTVCALVTYSEEKHLKNITVRIKNVARPIAQIYQVRSVCKQNTIASEKNNLFLQKHCARPLRIN